METRTPYQVNTPLKAEGKNDTITDGWVEVRCPICNVLLFKAKWFAGIIQIKCYGKYCSRPLVEYPTFSPVIIKDEVVSKVPKTQAAI